MNYFVSGYGALECLTYDGASVQVGRHTNFHNLIQKYEIRTHISAPRTPNENPVEGAIKEIKKRWYRIQAKLIAPDRLWDYGITYVCKTGNLTVNSSRYSNGRSPLEIVPVETPDVFGNLDFGFYDWVTYRKNAGLGHQEVGRWLGVWHCVGNLISYWIIPESGIVISCTTVQHIKNLERQTEEYKNRMNEFKLILEGKWTTISSDISGQTRYGPMKNVLSLEDEDE